MKRVFDKKQGKMVWEDEVNELKESYVPPTPEEAFRDNVLNLLRDIRNGITFFVVLAIIEIVLGVLAYLSLLH